MIRPRTEALAAWILLGVLALFAFPDAFTSPWGWMLGIPWILGGAIMIALPTAKLVSAARLPVDRLSVRLSLLALAGLLVLAALLVTPSAAVLALLWMGTAVLVLLWTTEADQVAELVVNVTVGAVALVLCGLAAELVLRHPALARQWGSPQERAAWEERYEGLWRQNVLGFRSPHESVTPPDGTLRVLALGDSFTWGDKIASADSTWPAALERELKRRLATEDIQVVNAGRRGFTTANEAELLRRLGWELGPDLVLVQYYVNDVFPSEPNFGRLGSDAVFDPIHLLPSRFRSGPAGSSALIAFLEGRLNSLLGPEPGERFAPLYRQGRTGWRQMRRAMDEMAAASNARNVPVLFFVVPALVPGQWTAATHPHRSIHQQVLSAADSAGLETLDLTPAFGEGDRDIEFWWATPYDSHPGVEAHRRIGQSIAEEVVARALLTVRGGDGDEQRR